VRWSTSADWPERLLGTHVAHRADKIPRLGDRTPPPGSGPVRKSVTHSFPSPSSNKLDGFYVPVYDAVFVGWL